MLKTLPLSKTTITIRSFCVAIVMLLTACGDEALPLGSLSDSIASINATEESDGSVTINFDPIDAPANEAIEPTANAPLVDDAETTNAEVVDTSEEEPAAAAQIDSNQDETAEVSNPEVEISTPVDATNTEVVITNFDITVPEYQSNELLVVLYHDGQSVEATYVEGQSWTATMSMPKNSTRTVQAIFFDRNGDLALAAAQNIFRATDLDTQDIGASQLWFYSLDYDQDGINNITELQQGTDPLTSDSEFLPAEITYQDDDILSLLRSITALYESQVPHNRPWSDSIDLQPGEVEGDPSGIRSFTVDIDSAGNGTYEFLNSVGPIREAARSSGSATRSIVNNTVVWDGEYRRTRYPVDSTSGNFTSETQRYSDLDLGQAGQLTHINRGDCCLPGGLDVEYSVIGRASTTEGYCDVSYGWITANRAATVTNFFRGTPITTSYTKANALRASNWRVRTSWNNIVFSDYELDYDGISTQFFCDFGEL